MVGCPRKCHCSESPNDSLACLRIAFQHCDYTGDARFHQETAEHASRRTKRWTEGRTDKRTDEGTNGRTDGRPVGRWTDGSMYGRTDGGTHGRTDGRRSADERTEGCTDGRTEGRMDARTDGSTNGRTGGRTDGRTSEVTPGMTLSGGRISMTRQMVSCRCELSCRAAVVPSETKHSTKRPEDRPIDWGGRTDGLLGAFPVAIRTILLISRPGVGNAVNAIQRARESPVTSVLPSFRPPSMSVSGLCGVLPSLGPDRGGKGWQVDLLSCRWGAGVWIRGRWGWLECLCLPARGATKRPQACEPAPALEQSDSYPTPGRASGLPSATASRLDRPHHTRTHHGSKPPPHRLRPA